MIVEAELGASHSGMAIRPHVGVAGTRGSSMPSGGGRRGGSELDIFGGGHGGGLFGGRDPFAEFGSMDPFGGSAFGGGFGNMGSMMQRFDDMSRDMMSGAGQGGGPSSMRGTPGGNGQYAMQSFSMSSVMGPDGKMHTEKFSSSDAGNSHHKVREGQQAYSNSTTGIEKMGLERQVGQRARKMVKERDRNTMEERSTEMFRGMDEGSSQAFDRDFGALAHHMPSHPRFDGRALQGMQGSSAVRGALPGSGAAGLGRRDVGGRQTAGLEDSTPSSGGRSGSSRQHSTPASYGRRR